MAAGPPIHELHYDDAPSVDSPPGPESRRLREKQQAIESSAALYPTDVPLVGPHGHDGRVPECPVLVLVTDLDLDGGLGTDDGQRRVLEIADRVGIVLQHAAVHADVQLVVGLTSSCNHGPGPARSIRPVVSACVL